MSHYTLAHVWSGVRSRLLDPNAAEPAAITIEANFALNELRGRFRQSREDWLDTTETTDILADKDVYPYPQGVDTLKQIERLDLVADQGIYPSQVGGYYDRQARDFAQSTKVAVANGVVVMPNRNIRLQPMPTTNFRDGLRWTYLPIMTELINPDDVVVGLPGQFFEWLIVGTIDRMRQVRGVQLADPKAYEQFRQEQTARLVRELRPQSLLGPPRIVDEDEFYLPT